MAVAALEDVQIHYEDRGSGPPLLLIPGIPAIASDWSLLGDRLARTRRVIAYDNRGSGGSTVTPGPYTTRQLAADAAGLLGWLGVGQADVFGISMGGMIAQELALDWPDLVRCLVLGCTHSGVAHAEPQPRETGRAFAKPVATWAERIGALAPFAFARGVDPELLGAFVAKKSGDVQAEEGYRAQIQAVLGHDAYDRLPDIRCPTLVLAGDDDRVIPASSSLVLRDRIPGARLHVVEGAGHLFFLERPDETLRVLEAFLSTER